MEFLAIKWLMHLTGLQLAHVVCRKFLNVRKHSSKKTIWYHIAHYFNTKKDLLYFKTVVLKTFWLVGHICLSETLRRLQEL